MRYLYRMTISVIVLVSLLAGLVGYTYPVSADQGNKDNEHYERLIVRFIKDTKWSERSQLHQDVGGELEAVINEIDAHVIKVPWGQRYSKLQSYKNSNKVAYAEVDALAEIIYEPNDAYFDESHQWGMFRIQAYQAWDITQGDPDICIAVLDTGIDIEHPDLEGKCIASTNFTDSESEYANGHSHGTHVAGITAALTNNEIGVAGMSGNASLMNVKVLNDSGYGYYSWIASGIIWAADNGADVINLSLGGIYPSNTLEDAVNYAWNKGVVVVAAAGNYGSSSPCYPACYENCIAVSATDYDDVLPSWSNYGDWVDVAAPGTAYSTMPDGQYGYKSGTSIASPFVTGLAGLVFSLASDVNENGRLNDEVRTAIESTCDDIDIDVVYGRINACHAVQSLYTPEYGRIEGIVRDIQTVEGIAGAEVMVDGQVVVTDESGLFEVNEVLAGEQLIAVEATGYERGEVVVEVVIGQGVLVEIELRHENRAPEIDAIGIRGK